MTLWRFLSPDEQWGILFVVMCGILAFIGQYAERRKPMRKQKQNIVAINEPPELVIARKDELQRLREARLLLEGLNPSVWANDVLYDLQRWERHVQTKHHAQN